MMPWDLETGHVNGSPYRSHSNRDSQCSANASTSGSVDPYTHFNDGGNQSFSHTTARSHHSLSDLGSHHSVSAHGSGSLDSHNDSNENDDGPRGSLASQSDLDAPASHVSYGTERWEGLENAETGRTGFQSYTTW